MAGSGKPGFWGAMFGQTSASAEGDRFTLEELRRLHAVLSEEKTVTGAWLSRFCCTQLGFFLYYLGHERSGATRCVAAAG